MNTDNLFITRKRKKWKFAHFDEWPNCVTLDQVQPSQWQQPLVVEIAAGTADLSVGLAAQRPEAHFVAVDIKSDRLYTGAKFALEHHLHNITFVRAHMSHLTEIFLPGGISELWLTFPDPFPRKKQAKHRLTHPQFLQQYAKVLRGDGVLRFKTDNRDLFLWSLEQLVAEGWQLAELTFDLHDSALPEAYKITTAYERRFIAEGIPINYVTLRPPAV
ncbi:MAG TPA: tRNA (guanosine(46)-N7)-methyltransferase TrmB [Candidatus Saccharimonadales bacterium]|nr:tRNA (guanosine(46)-N7)-methyltransferase TrmB [Candidatus Saccharimonadales bacterium]